MSTKIYDAFRGKIADLNKTLEYFDKHFREAAAARIAALMLVADESKIRERVQEFEEGDWQRFSRLHLNLIYKEQFLHGSTELMNDGMTKVDHFIFGYIMAKAKEATTDIQKNAFDIECHVLVYILNDEEILGRLCAPQGLLNDVPLPEHLEDYSYWNNTDQPDGITDEAWDKRQTDWDIAIPSENYFARQLEHPSVKFDYFPIMHKVERRARALFMENKAKGEKGICQNEKKNPVGKT